MAIVRADRKKTSTDSSRSNHSSAVGYGRPPTHTQFKPGQSGNPKGRPSGRKAVPDADALQILGTLLRKILMEKVAFRDGDRIRRISNLEAIIRSMIARARKGEMRHAGKILDSLGATSQAVPSVQNNVAPDFQLVFVPSRHSKEE